MKRIQGTISPLAASLDSGCRRLSPCGYVLWPESAHFVCCTIIDFLPLLCPILHRSRLGLGEIKLCFTRLIWEDVVLVTWTYCKGTGSTKCL
jgi:hypothetical protein